MTIELAPDTWWNGVSVSVATMPSLPNGRGDRVLKMWRDARLPKRRRGYSQSHWRKIIRSRPVESTRDLTFAHVPDFSGRKFLVIHTYKALWGQEGA